MKNLGDLAGAWKRPRYALSLLPLAVCLILTAGCGAKEASEKGAGNKKGGAGSGAPVVVQAVEKRDVPIEVRAIGNVEAYSSVAVKSQVAGQLQRVYFKEGDDVRKGQLLFLIDPRTFEEQVQQAEAQVAKDVAAEKQAEAQKAKDAATAANAKTQAGRYADLAAKGVVSREQNDQFASTAEAAAQAVEADQANIESAKATIRADQSKLADAKLQLSYTRIQAPVSGRTGNLTIKEGNLVQTDSATPLVTINVVTPVYVTFSIPEEFLSAVKRRSTQSKLKIEAVLSQGEQTPSFGLLDFIDNAVDPTTGTIKMKGTFANADHRLWPGQFVNVVMTIETQAGATVVPTAAVQTGQKGKYVFVVKPDQTAEQRQVIATRIVGDRMVVDKGLEPGEQVVTDGQLRVVPGAKVDIVRGQGGAGSQTQEGATPDKQAQQGMP